MIPNWKYRSVERVLIGEARTNLVTLGTFPDRYLTEQLKKTKRHGDKLATIVDVRKSPKLDLWEDFLADGLPNAILLRPGVSLPQTPLTHFTPLKFPDNLANLGQWLKPNPPSFGWTFSPNWKFPQWISSRLIKLYDCNPPRMYKFADLSAIGLDSLLMEYAGLIQRGFEFSIKEARRSPRTRSCSSSRRPASRDRTTR